MLTPRDLKRNRVAGLLLVLIVLSLPQNSLSQPSDSRQVFPFGNLQITTEGKGRDVVFIPGLNSSSAVFSGLCAEIKHSYRCHLVHLPGFAGLAPEENLRDGFLARMRDSLIHYIQEQELSDPVVVGHSLGGVLGLMIAMEAPSLPSALVIVDSLPFLPAAQFPGASVATMLPIAERMRAGMLSQSKEQFEQATPRQLVGLSNDPARFDELLEWSLSSDQATMAQAMYELYTQDLRADIAELTTPTLVFGAWAAYEQFGATLANTTEKYQNQYRAMSDVQIKMSDSGYHFLMWDDPKWMLEGLVEFLAEN